MSSFLLRVACVSMGLIGVVPMVYAQSAPPSKPNLLVDGAPTVKSWVPPVYPADLKSQKVQGEVTVQYVVDVTGAVSGFRVVKASDPRFRPSALDSIAKWTFEPGVDQSKAVKMAVQSVISFHLPEPKPGLMPPQRWWPTELPKKTAVAESVPDPTYPDALVSRRLNGDVEMAFTIGEDGAVNDWKVLSATRPDFVAPMIEAVRHWKYKPAHRGDVPVDDTKVSAYSFSVYVPAFEDGVPAQLEANGLKLRTTENQSAKELCTMPPELWIFPEPVYPYALATTGKAGTASVEFDIDEQGNAENPHIAAADDEQFGQALLTALVAAKFKPAMTEGKTVSVPMVWKYSFSQPEDKVPESGESSELRLLRALKGGEVIGTPKGLDGKLVPLWRLAPSTSAAMKAEGAKGRAEIEFIIDREGRVRWPHVVSADNADFGLAASLAVSQWVFAPPTRGGQPTDVRARIPFQF